MQRNANADPLVAGRDVTLSRYEVPQSPIQWSVQKFRMFGGKQEGIDVIWIDNGKLQIGVIPTRGMGIQVGDHGWSEVLGWDSPVKDVVHPKLHQPEQPRRPGLAGGVQRVALPLRAWNGTAIRGPTDSSTTWAKRPRWT